MSLLHLRRCPLPVKIKYRVLMRNAETPYSCVLVCLFAIHIYIIKQPISKTLHKIPNCILIHGYGNMDYEQIYHVWERYLRKIPVEKRKISRADSRGEFSLKTGNFRKYPSQYDKSV
jgi:hypothetical protein